MTLTINDLNTSFHTLMKQTVGKWKGYRIYESVKTGKVTKVSNTFEVTLNQTDQNILEDLHKLPSRTFPYLIEIHWRSRDTDTGKLLSEGSMLMGYHGGYLYRDRGYVTDQPLISKVEMLSPDHMVLRTFYQGVTTLGDETVAYEENFRWAGNHRLRTILAWDKKHQLTLIGQYIEHKQQD
ncbi:MAG: phycobiliprotein lyase [Prochloraceae cyanobacterium]